ncbi:ribosome biogenesis GTP-binding protein YihA/YsxC [Levyella massiliensis]|uniref:ribosome biogenesis GTP-binding protein YihA/YsxC n=1 Tax=Levyella massiliensis TaxID=938289 RepID=UPI0024AE719E|nr:ribosome biogenesis GTP-binding protein YihA/YsxC [Levyella massiliensis]
MKIITSALEAMAALPSQYPTEELPEIAFAGRSNVGKSTLINSLCQRKKLAYTSATPGKTRTVNFYRIEAEWEEARHAFRLVDLPGYGYAKASRKAQEEWAAGINTYLESRSMLREVILLCDLRHAPTALDKQMYTWIRSNGYVGHVIATKADKVPVTKIRAQQKVLAQTLGTDVAHIHPYAGNVATKSFGSEELRLLLLPIVS